MLFGQIFTATKPTTVHSSLRAMNWGGARLESTDKLAIPQDDCDAGELICTKNQGLDDLHISCLSNFESFVFCDQLYNAIT